MATVIDLDDVARRCGLLRSGSHFVHESTRQQFVLVPAGAFVMGMTGGELCEALREARYNPDVEFWRAGHARAYAAAQPPRAVSVQAFLVGRSPLLAATAEAAGVRWTTHETTERRGKTTAARMTPEAAMAALAHFGWALPSEAQWEYVARAGGVETWAGGADFREAVETQVHDPHFDPQHCNAWGVWGLGLGEWVSDQWHDDYRGAPSSASAWREHPGPPTMYRGGAVLHAPWQDSDEVMSCHAAKRGGPASPGSVFVARPVVALPWLQEEISMPVAPSSVSFDEAVAALETEIRSERERKRRADDARREKMARTLGELPGSVRQGTIRSVGEGGVYIVSLAEVNGILRMPADATPLAVGDPVTVRIVGSGGVPEVELVSSP
ncbi:MAG: hypothetical protein R3B13_12125 [Polyangiaceae bacterium]